MKIRHESIRPKVFSVEYADGWHHLLACERRIFKAGPSEEKGKGRGLAIKGHEWTRSGSWEKVLFPVMIELGPPNIPTGPPPVIHFLVDGHDRNWTVSDPSVFGMSDHAAAHAIAEAWRGIVASHSGMETMLPHVEYSVRPLVEYKQASALWMLNAWLRWDSWNKRGLNMPQRARELQDAGFRVKPSMIKNAADVRRMPKSLKEDPLV